MLVIRFCFFPPLSFADWLWGPTRFGSTVKKEEKCSSSPRATTSVCTMHNRRIGVAWVACVSGFAWAAQMPIPITFGNGVPGFSICEAPTVVLNYSLTANSSYGLLTHFWTTGGSGIDDIIVECVSTTLQNDPSSSLHSAVDCCSDISSTARMSLPCRSRHQWHAGRAFRRMLAVTP